MSLTDNRIQQIIDENGGNFTVREFGESRARQNPEAIKQLVLFRNWHGFMTLLTPEGKWRAQGAHAFGAFDQVLYSDWKHRQPDPMRIWRIATTWPWSGVGIYFDVTAYGKPAIMIHTDPLRHKQSKNMDSDRPLRWLRVNGDYFYQSLINGRFYYGDEETTLEAEIEKWQKGINQE